MRLLRTASDERLRWTKDYIGDEKVPPYAILSHTWKEGQEVTFDDLKNLNIDDREGYQKIRFCSQQARHDGLEYFWVDTCCIDKANNTELSEAINSMFRWYQNTERCYVYLLDVTSNTSDRDGESSQTWLPEFRRSRWFTRGWTLQEPLAPKIVEFFSKEGQRLGDKESLQHPIHDITGIPIEALRGTQLSNFSVDERFSWTANRQTTHKEDGAYCLLGIFDVHLPLIYGEGKEKALKRLRREIRESLDDIPSAAVIENNEGRTPDQEVRLDKIRQRLFAPDPSTNYHKAHKHRQVDTGLWLLESEKYAMWKAGAASRLWLYGIPGCGKTVLSSTIIENLLQHCLDNPGTVTAYFYFDFNDIQKQDPELMLHSLLRQLLQCSIVSSGSLDALFTSCENERRPSLHAILEAIRETMQEFTHVYLVLDALDECTKRAELMNVLEIVTGWQLQNLHLLITSRKERDIESSLEDYVDDTICLQSEVVDKDIQRYVQQRLSTDKSLLKWVKNAAVRQEIETTLMHGAHVMFRWAACQLDTLGKCRNRAMLRKSLATLPPTLDQTYDRILLAISEEDSKYALRIFQWLMFSARPLSVEELAEVVAIDVARDPAFDRDEVLEDPLEVLNICSSLVFMTADSEDWSSRPVKQIITLAHYSVQEYLLSERIQQGQAKKYSMHATECHGVITRCCLEYLYEFPRFRNLSEQVVEGSTLARYSPEFWNHHLRKTGESVEEISSIAVDMFSIETPAYLTWIQLCDPDNPWQRPNLRKTLEESPAPIYYKALLGSDRIVELLLDKDAGINAQGGHYGNALQAASAEGHEQVVKLLLDKGANVNAQGGHFYNSLFAASVRGHERVVKLLLERGADVNAWDRDSLYSHAWSTDSHYSNALQAASGQGNEQVVKLLLDKGANVNARGGKKGSALQAASAKGREQVVKLLLDKGADVHAQDGQYGNALQVASSKGHEQVVKLLLDKGAGPNAQGKSGPSALRSASEGGYVQVVKMLLQYGANVNANSREYANALYGASKTGNEEVVKLLLEKGANVNAQGGRYDNPLQAASERGDEKIVRLLLERGADVNAKSNIYGNALYAASRGGDEEVVKILLENGADVNAQGGRYSNALQVATDGGYELVVKLLLDKGADVDAESRHRNALCSATEEAVPTVPIHS